MKICKAEAHLSVDGRTTGSQSWRGHTIFLGYLTLIYQPLHGPGLFPATWGLLAKWQRDLRSCNYYPGLELDPEKGLLCARTQPAKEGFSEEEPRGSFGSWKGRGSSQKGLEGE